MALQTPSRATSYDQSAVYKLDLSEVLAAILLDDTDFVSMIGISNEVAKQTKHSWIEDALNAVTIKQSGGTANQLALGTTSGTLLVLSASQAARITAGSLLKNQLSGKTEVIQVTALSTNSATVVRGFGSTSAVTHAAGAVWDIIANPRPQGMTGPKDESTTRGLKYNFTQIFSKGVKITGTAQAIEHAGVSAEDNYQIDLRLREMKRELDRTAIMGIRAATDVVDATYGTMGGMIDFCGFLNTTNNISTAETLTTSVLNTMIKKCWDVGLTPTHILVGGVQKQKISSFDAEYRRSSISDRSAGYTVEDYISDLGISLRVIVDRWMPTDVAIVFDSAKVKIMPLNGRSFFLEQLAKTGDSNDWQIVGEYTMEVRNADAACYHFNLKQ